MTLFRNKYRIESARKPNWDYSWNGYYFITICTKNKENSLGFIENDEMQLNDFGKIVEKCWYDLPNHYPNLKLDAFVIMPNHIHGIMVIENDVDDSVNFHVDSNDNVETGLRPVSTITQSIVTTTEPTNNHGISEFVHALKSFSSRKINEIENTPGIMRWQTRFYDHIIRNDLELQRIRWYIKNNPKNWNKDSLKL